MPSLQRRTRLAIRPFGRIAQLFGGVAVHQHLACDHAKTAALGGAEKRIDRFGVHGAEDQGGGRAVAAQFIEEGLPRDLREALLRLPEAAASSPKV